MDANYQDVADTLWSAMQSGVPCEPIRERLGVAALESAYAVQDINTKRAEAAGRRPVGCKIGLTSLAVQKQLGVDQPDYGMLFDDMAIQDGWEIPRQRLIQPKAEVEIAFVLGRDLCEERITVADMFRAIDYVVPAIEIVDSRIAGWKIGIVDTIADNASSGLYVLGCTPRRLEGLDLAECRMTFECEGKTLATGTGSACLGNPISAALWLARMMARVGRPLREGDTILSGALGPMIPALWGNVMEARISGLGSVRASFSKE